MPLPQPGPDWHNNLNSDFAICWMGRQAHLMQSGGKKYPREEKLLYTFHCCPLCGTAKLHAPKAVCLHHLKLLSTLEHHLSRAQFSVLYSLPLWQSKQLTPYFRDCNSHCLVPNHFPSILCSLTAALWHKVENKSLVMFRQDGWVPISNGNLGQHKKFPTVASPVFANHDSIPLYQQPKDSNNPNLFVPVLKWGIFLPQKDAMRLSSLLVMMSFQEQQMNNKQRQNIVKKILGESQKGLNNTGKRQ